MDTVLKRSQRGFTLIELLIVVAILGILAAVVIPNVGRFLGRGETEGRKTEVQNIQTSVTALMVENGLSEILAPVGSVSGGTCSSATNDMTAFPDATTVIATKANYLAGTWAVGDDPGFVLFDHDFLGNASTTADPKDSLNYVNFRTAKYYYVVAEDGTVTQCASADGAAFTD